MLVQRDVYIITAGWYAKLTLMSPPSPLDDMLV
jgi:hypothetical protein